MNNETLSPYSAPDCSQILGVASLEKAEVEPEAQEVAPEKQTTQQLENG